MLVVDDDRDATDALVMLLQQWGFGATAVYDGAGAILAHDLLQPALVLLDLGMPDIDGLEVATVIRRSCPAWDVRLVAMTCRDTEAGRVVSACVGFDEHICRPISRSRLHLLALDAPRRASPSRGGSLDA